MHRKVGFDQLSHSESYNNISWKMMRAEIMPPPNILEFDCRFGKGKISKCGAMCRTLEMLKLCDDEEKK